MKPWIISVLIGCLLSVDATAGTVIDISPLVREHRQTEDPGRRRLLSWKLAMVAEEFPHSEAAARAQITDAYPEVSADTLTAWLNDPRTPCVVIDGERRFFSGIAKNFGFRNLPHLRRKLAGDGAGSPFFDQLEHIIFAPETSGYPPQPWQSYHSPVTFLGTVTVHIPRAELPATGTVTLWIPLPVQTGSQRNPAVIAVQPAAHVVTTPRMDGDFGFVHFEIPMPALKEDLDCRVQFQFTSYRQQFQVDPERVLPYDKQSALYRQYTRSYRNTAITPAISEEAQRAVGDEKNPFRMARKVYEHILANTPYSLAPHVTLQVMGIPESVYVQDHGHGDCGAQSMLFSAMCRALGIPARAIGGYQMIMGQAGTHFWAEFYLEGYGWVPVDVTVAEAGDWTGEITEDQRRRYKSFFFGQLDPYRYVIQKDVDLPLAPPPSETVLTDDAPPVVVQGPFIACPSCDANPFELLDRYTTIAVTPVDR